MAAIDRVKVLLNDVLQLGGRASGWDESTPLLGNVAELDSMVVANVITALEDELGLAIDDDDINGDVFATLGTLTQFVERKQRA